MKHLIVIALIFGLTACGGGGGGSSSQIGVASSSATYPAPYGSMVLGKFKDQQTQFLVYAHYKFLGNGQTGPIPVKIYQLNSDGTMLDSTIEILGEQITLSTNVPLVADFNHDGIDDLFFPGFSDTQELLPSVAFISRPGQSHTRVDLPNPVWAHGTTVIDINNDTHLDIVDNWGNTWTNNGQGNFTFRSHTYTDVPNMWMHGSGVCAGDFNQTGKSQLVVTDQSVDPDIGPIADTVIFEIDNRGLPTAQHYLPVPVLDRNSISVERSHDVTCKVADLNNDNLPDILVFSRPLPLSGSTWTNEGAIQVLINQGNWQFTDATDQILSGYNNGVLVSYTAMIVDLNDDGFLDIWAGYFDSYTGNATQVMLNNSALSLTIVSQSLINSFDASGGMLPVKFNNKWAFVFVSSDYQNGSSTIYLTKPLYTF